VGSKYVSTFGGDITDDWEQLRERHPDNEGQLQAAVRGVAPQRCLAHSRSPVRGRRSRTGVVFAFAFFDHDRINWTRQLGELFKIENGLIRRIEAVFHRAPYGTASGRSTYEQAMCAVSRSLPAPRLQAPQFRLLPERPTAHCPLRLSYHPPVARLLVLLGGVAWLFGMILFATVIRWSSQPRVAPVPVQPPPLVRELNSARPSPGEQGLAWIVTRATSAHRVLVVDVDAERVGEARAIAVQVVEPVRDKGYEEILLYVWKAGSEKPYADRRIQWTPAGGYSELVIGD
jgi:hypothetical protein